MAIENRYIVYFRCILYTLCYYLLNAHVGILIFQATPQELSSCYGKVTS
jgi:hypothetical protein